MEASLRLPRADRSKPTIRFFLSNTLPFFFLFFVFFQTCHSSTQNTTITPGFIATQKLYVDNGGFFLVSPSKAFLFGFKASPNDATSFLLSIIFRRTSADDRVVWTANQTAPVQGSDTFEFTSDGKVRLTSGDTEVWSLKVVGATRTVLTDTRNLVLLKGGGGGGGGEADQILWQSFDHPTDTLLPGQSFKAGMAMSVSVDPSKGLKGTYSLQAASGDVRLLAGFATQQQPYWSISMDVNKFDQVTGGVAGEVQSATMLGNSWEFYDGKGGKLTQLTTPASGDANASLAVVLDSSGFLNFYDLNLASLTPVKIPAPARRLNLAALT